MFFIGVQFWLWSYSESENNLNSRIRIQIKPVRMHNTGQKDYWFKFWREVLFLYHSILGLFSGSALYIYIFCTTNMGVNYRVSRCRVIYSFGHYSMQKLYNNSLLVGATASLPEIFLFGLKILLYWAEQKWKLEKKNPEHPCPISVPIYR